MTPFSALLGTSPTLDVGRALVGAGLGLAAGGLTLGLFAIAAAPPGLARRCTLRALGGRPLGRLEAPELAPLVQGLARRAGVVEPRIHVLPHAQANVFVVGGDDRPPVLCVTRGALDVLSPTELEAAVAAAVVRTRRDVLRRGTLAAAVGMVPSAVAGLGILRAAEVEEAPLGWVPALPLVPAGAALSRLVGGPVRDTEADVAGARLSGLAREAARALERMEYTAHVAPMAIPGALARLALVDPLGRRRDHSLARLFPGPAPSAARSALLRTLLSTAPGPSRARAA